MGLSHSPRIVTDGLVFCVDAANRRSYPGAGTTWTDLTANKNNGTLTNMTDNFSTDGGGSLTFDGTNDRVECGSNGGDLINGLSQLTLEMWFKSDAINNDRGLIFGDSSSNNADNGFGLRYDNGGANGGGDDVLKAGFGINNAGNSTNLESSANLQSTDWMCIDVVCDVGTSIDLYKDGLLDSPTATQINGAVTSISNCNNLVIGRGAKTQTWLGKIAVVRIYNKILTPDEIRQNYLATKGRFQ